MNSTAPARVQQKQAVREVNRLAAQEDYVDTITSRDPEGSWLGLGYPNRATRRALREEDPGPNVSRQNRSDARRKRGEKARRVRSTKAQRIARRAEQRRVERYGDV